MKTAAASRLHWNNINGHDRLLVSGDGLMDDLQYACIFPLPEPRDCTDPANALACDCAHEVSQDEAGDAGGVLSQAANNPLCRNPEDGSYGTTQYFAKAYPGTRILQLLRAMGDQGVVGSICPKNAEDTSRPDYGYRPPARALLEVLAPAPILL